MSDIDWQDINSAPVEEPLMVFIPRGKHKGFAIAWREFEYLPLQHWILNGTWEEIRVTPTKWRRLSDEEKISNTVDLVLDEIFSRIEGDGG